MSLKTFKNYSYYDINEILTSSEINNLPYTIRILLENMVRVNDFGLGTQTDVDNGFEFQAVSGYTPLGPANEGATGRWRSPYIRNCTNFMTGSIGMKINGSKLVIH